MGDKRLLVDTSAWIVSFHKGGNEELKSFLRTAIDENRIVTAPPILLELLQGCKAEKEFDVLKNRLESFASLSLENLDWDKLYLLAFSLRKKGLTLPTVDILIAFLCIEKAYSLLHHDRHFRKIAQHTPLDAIDFLGK